MEDGDQHTSEITQKKSQQIASEEIQGQHDDDETRNQNEVGKTVRISVRMYERKKRNIVEHQVNQTHDRGENPKLHRFSQKR